MHIQHENSFRNHYTMIKLLFFVLILIICIIQSRVALGESDQSGKCSTKIELNSLRDIVITRVDTDGYSGTIQYEANDKVRKIINLKQMSKDKMKPILTIVNDTLMRLSDLQGAQISMLMASRRDCSISHPVIGYRHLSNQWIIQAEVAGRK